MSAFILDIYVSVQFIYIYMSAFSLYIYIYVSVQFIYVYIYMCERSVYKLISKTAQRRRLIQLELIRGRLSCCVEAFTMLLICGQSARPTPPHLILTKRHCQQLQAKYETDIASGSTALYSIDACSLHATQSCQRSCSTTRRSVNISRTIPWRPSLDRLKPGDIFCGAIHNARSTSGHCTMQHLSRRKETQQRKTSDMIASFRPKIRVSYLPNVRATADIACGQSPENMFQHSQRVFMYAGHCCYKIYGVC
jgi:hypothetical protein